MTWNVYSPYIFQFLLSEPPSSFLFTKFTNTRGLFSLSFFLEYLFLFYPLSWSSLLSFLFLFTSFSFLFPSILEASALLYPFYIPLPRILPTGADFCRLDPWTGCVSHPLWRWPCRQRAWRIYRSFVVVLIQFVPLSAQFTVVFYKYWFFYIKMTTLLQSGFSNPLSHSSSDCKEPYSCNSFDRKFCCHGHLRSGLLQVRLKYFRQ